jgi:hypothetical protein
MNSNIERNASMNIYPYVYKCTHKTTSEFYFGFRKANKVPAEFDLGIVYKTSSKIVKPNFDNYNYEILAVFYESQDANDFEQNLIKEHWGHPLLLNKSFGGNPPTNKNLVVVKDSTGVMFRVSVNDPRYISGELVSFQTGKCISESHKKNISNSQKNWITVKDNKTGIGFRIHKDDPTLSNYVGINYGSKRSTETKKLQSKSAKLACVTKHITYVSRLIDKKVMRLMEFNRWVNDKKTNVPAKLLCSRLSDRKVMTVNHLNRTRQSYLQLAHLQKKMAKT